MTSINSEIFCALIGLVAARDRVLDAMGDVILQHLLLDPAQRGAHRRDLRDDVDAVAVLLDHLRQAADLALDPAQPFLTGCLDVFPHAAYIPPQGIGCKAGDRNERRGRRAAAQRRHVADAAVGKLRCRPRLTAIAAHRSRITATSEHGVRRSRLRHDGRSRDLEASLRPSTARPSISARPAAAPNSPPIPQSISTRRTAPPSRVPDRHDLHLPDASGDPPGRPGQLPDLRHGAGAGGREPAMPGPIPNSPT